MVGAVMAKLYVPSGCVLCRLPPEKVATRLPLRRCSVNPDVLLFSWPDNAGDTQVFVALQKSSAYAAVALPMDRNPATIPMAMAFLPNPGQRRLFFFTVNSLVRSLPGGCPFASLTCRSPSQSNPYSALKAYCVRLDSGVEPGTATTRPTTGAATEVGS